MSTKDKNAILALPIDDPESSPIVAGGLLRAVHVAGLTFRIHAYDGLEKRLGELGYREGDRARPAGAGEYYYFPYDWRQSVETNGRRFSRELDALYARAPAGTPPAIVLGHSLGGLIARYGLMYGDTPLGRSGALPPVTWAERAHIGTIFLVATPNEGTFLALQRLEKGIFYWRGYGAFSPETLFTYPSVFDMIPGTIPPLVDRHGKPLPFNLEDAGDWERLGWSILDPEADSRIPYAARREHLTGELARIERLQAALEQRGSEPNPATLYVVGSLSRSVQRTALLSQSSHGLKVRFDAPAASRARLKKLLFEPGDAMVPARSLTAESSDHDPAGSLGFARVYESKRSHQDLLSSPETLAALGDALK
jgi:pimeloyl-ACP methyl ester carboxylesterase